MRGWAWWLSAAALLLLLAVAALGIAVTLLDPNDYKPQIVAAVQKEVPEQASLTVRHRDVELALEVAFYAFPRRVFFERKSESGVVRLMLRPGGSGTWVVADE